MFGWSSSAPEECSHCAFFAVFIGFLLLLFFYFEKGLGFCLLCWVMCRIGLQMRRTLETESENVSYSFFFFFYEHI